VARWRKQLAAAVAGVCRELIPQTLTLEQVKALEVFLPHIQVVAEHLADDLGEEDLLWPTAGLARVAKHQAAFAEALKWYQLALELSELRLGPNHPSTAGAINNLAQLLQATNRLAEAEPLMARGFAVFWQSLGFDHPNTQSVGGNYIALLQALGLSEPEIQAKLQALQPPT